MKIPKLTLAHAKKLVLACGFTLQKKDGEYIIRGKQKGERKIACSTNSIHHAVVTAQAAREMLSK